MTDSSKNVAIIGAGIVGASAAFYLSKQFGDQLDIYDEGKGQATSAAAGIICPWLSLRRNKKWYKLVKNGAAMYPDFLKEAGVTHQDTAIYENNGVIVFKKSPEKLADLFERAKKRREDAPEIGELKQLSADGIRAIVPIYEGNSPGLFVSGASRVDGKLLVSHLIKQVKENGANVFPNRAQLSLGTEKKYRVKTEQTSREYDQVILAAGAWLPFLLKPFGYQVDVHAQKGQLAELTLPYPESGNWPVVMPEGEMDIIFFPDGKTFIGASHENPKEYDLTVEKSVLEPMVEEAANFFSSQLKAPSYVDYRVGTRAYTSDFSSFMGEVPDMPDLYTASGLGSTGLTAGPLVGKILSQLVLREEPDLPLTDYPVKQYITKK